MSTRLAAPFLAATLSLSGEGLGTAAHADQPVLVDGTLVNWRFLVPPDDPDVTLGWPATGNTYLTVQHRHTLDFYSIKRSLVGDPAVSYDPAVSGAVDSFTFSADFRSLLQGAPLHTYASTSVAVRAAILQGGERFVAQSYLYLMVRVPDRPPGWAPFFSGTLGARDFWRNRTEEVHPDFSAAGPPLTLALEVESAYQTSVPQTPEHLFKIDIDDVAFHAVPAGPSGAPSVRIGVEYGIEEYRGRPTAVFIDEREVGESPGRQLGLTLRLSATATEDAHFRILREAPEPPGVPQTGRIRAGNGSTTMLVPADRVFEVYRLEGLEGTPTGVPDQATFLSLNFGDSPEHECVMDWLDLIFDVLSNPPGSPPPAPKLAVPTRLSAPSEPGDRRALLPTLRSFRDNVMMTSPAGRYYSALYSTWSPDLRRAILRRPTLIFDIQRSHGAWVEALGALVAGTGAATPVTADMAADLNRILDTLSGVATPALARAIATERERLELDAIAGTSIAGLWQRVVDRVEPEPCVAGGPALCIGGGGQGRYRVEADWKTPAGAAGRAHAVALSGDSGYFWFFDPANVELLTKIVDGCGLNQRIWSYSAGLTNLEVDLFVLDTVTGRGKSYRNPQAASFAPVLDSDYLECDEPGSAAARPVVPQVPQVLPLGGGNCLSGPTTLCLDGGRFRVEADWRTAAGTTGAARAVPLTEDTGTFWFFHPANTELVVKTIDACGLAGFENYWVFAGGTTDVEVTMRVTDTERNVSKTYRRPLGVPFAPILDSGAFATCP